MYKVSITVTLRPAILDPQGKAAQHALQNLGFDEISSVRIGKFIELEVSAESQEDAVNIANAACEKLLANPIMENHDVSVDTIE